MIDPRTGHKYKKKYAERESISRRPKKGEKTCSFCIKIKWEPDDKESSTGRWFIYGGEMCHNGHLQKQPLLQEEGDLSQYAALQKATDDDGGNHVAAREAPEDYFPGPGDNGDEEVSTSSPSDVNNEEEPPGCIASINIREPNPERLEAMQKANRQGGFYNDWMPLYQQMTNLASTNPGRFGHVCFEAMQGAVAHMQADTIQMPINAAMSNTISFPAVDRQKTCNRMRQASSPAKKRSKHK
jgi:hypothetical protein